MTFRNVANKLVQCVALTAVSLCVSSFAFAAPASQFLLVDEVIEYTDNWNSRSPAWVEKPFDGFYMSWMGEHFRERRSKEIPDSWLAPVNFAEGRVFTRVEVLKKPDSFTASGIILRMTTTEHAGNHTFWLCTKTCKFNKTGLYNYEENVADGTRPYGKDFRFDAPLWELQVVVTDDKDGIVHKKWEGGYAGKPNIALYLPLTVRVSSFVVAKGEKFQAPSWWNKAEASQATAATPQWEVLSPDGQTGAVVTQTKEGKLQYTVTTGKAVSRKPVVGVSPLGVVRSDVDLSTALTVTGVKQAKIKESYDLIHGKRRQVTATANELTLQVQRDGHAMDVVFRAYDDGVAFRYRMKEKAGIAYTISSESTAFQLPATARGWLLAHDDPSDWTPSYEGYWSANVAAGTTSPNKAGWALPALFAVNDEPKGPKANWVMLAESDLQLGWAGTRLAAEAKNALYSIRYPDKGEGLGHGDVMPALKGTTQSPWRVIFAVPSLESLLRSTLVTDLATASKLKNTAWVKPGRASWSWWSDTTGGAERLRSFVDLAANMGWEYSLVDAGWDRLPEGELQALAAYARKQNVKLLLWYNSGGPNNPVKGTPRDRMTERAIRRAEMNRIAELGIAGVKIDFFHSDKPIAIEQYLGILQDAADFKLLVNFHGCTMPRGWERTYPNLMSMESNRGEEMYKSDKMYPELAPVHQMILPFTRNVVGPMDFTPAGLSFVGYQRHTTDTYELAETVVYESGITHIADKAEAYSTLPKEAQEFLRKLPVTWDDLKLISGFPGESIVLARRAGNKIFVGGMSASDKASTFEFEVPFLVGDKTRTALLLTDDANGHVQAKEITVASKQKVSVVTGARGGLVIMAP